MIIGLTDFSNYSICHARFRAKVDDLKLWDYRFIVVMEAFKVLFKGGTTCSNVISYPKDKIYSECQKQLGIKLLEIGRMLQDREVALFNQFFNKSIEFTQSYLSTIQDCALHFGEDISCDIGDIKFVASPFFKLRSQDKDFLFILDDSKSLSKLAKRKLDFMTYCYWKSTGWVPASVSTFILPKNECRSLGVVQLTASYIKLFESSHIIPIVETIKSGYYKANVTSFCSKCSLSLTCKDYKDSRSDSLRSFNEELRKKLAAERKNLDGN